MWRHFLRILGAFRPHFRRRCNHIKKVPSSYGKCLLCMWRSISSSVTWGKVLGKIRNVVLLRAFSIKYHFVIVSFFTWRLYLILEHQYQPVPSFLLTAAILVCPYLQLKYSLCTSGRNQHAYRCYLMESPFCWNLKLGANVEILTEVSLNIIKPYPPCQELICANRCEQCDSKNSRGNFKSYSQFRKSTETDPLNNIYASWFLSLVHRLYLSWI